MLSIKEIHVVEDKKNVSYVLFCKYASNAQFLPANLILTRVSVSYSGSINSLENTESTKELLRDKDPSILTLEALTNNDNSKKFFFEIKRNERDINFMWKYSPASEVKILLGSVILKPDEDSTDTVLKTLKLLGERIRTLEKTNDELDKIRTELNGEKAKLLSTVEEHVSEKEVFEKEMYTKFTMVLNSKKLKCKELKKTLSSIESTPDKDLPTVSQSSNEGLMQRKKQRSKGVKYLDSDNSDLDIPEASQFKRKIQPNNNPSKNSESPCKISRPAVDELSSSEDSCDADKLLDDI